MTSPDSHHISRLVVEHGPFMERLSKAITGTAAEAEDLLHDTWVEALKHGVEAMRSERGWLVTVMRRRAGALRRKRLPLPVAGRARHLRAAATSASGILGSLLSIAMKKSVLCVLFLVFAVSTLWVIQRGPLIENVQPVEAPAGSSALRAASLEGGVHPDATLVALPASPGKERTSRKGGVESMGSLVVTLFEANGEPTSSGRVVAALESVDGAPGQHFLAPVSPLGRATFLDMRPGRYKVQAAINSASKRVDIESGVEAAATLQEEGDLLFYVRGKVVDLDGQPVPGATVWGRLLGPFLPVAQTRADGSFDRQFSSDSWIQASLPGRLPSSSVPVSDLDGDALMGRTCTLTLGAPASRLTGRVIAPDGTGVAGALVTAGSLERAGSQGSMFISPAPVTVITGEEGRFEYGHALPVGTWRVGALAPDGRGLVRWLEVADADLDVLLTIQPGATMTGVVKGVDGQAAEGAQVSLRTIQNA